MIQLSEPQYVNLYKYAVHVAYWHTQDRDASLDIVQDAFLSLFSTGNQVISPYQWMRSTIKHEYIKQSKSASKQRSLAREIAGSSPEKTDAPLKDEDAILLMPEAKIQEYLTADDYAIFQAYQKAGLQVHKYAAMNHLPYNTAKEHKKKIKRNLMAKHLWDSGWRTGKQILSYNQYNQIKRFINHLLSYVKSKKTAMLQHYVSQADAPQVEALFSDVASLREWYSSVRQDFLLITLVCDKISTGHKFLYLRIVFDPKNIIHIIKAYEPEIVAQCVGSMSTLEPYKEKGIIQLTNKQVIDLVSGKQVKT